MMNLRPLARLKSLPFDVKLTMVVNGRVILPLIIIRSAGEISTKIVPGLTRSSRCSIMPRIMKRAVKIPWNLKGLTWRRSTHVAKVLIRLTMVAQQIRRGKTELTMVCLTRLPWRLIHKSCLSPLIQTIGRGWRKMETEAEVDFPVVNAAKLVTYLGTARPAIAPTKCTWQDAIFGTPNLVRILRSVRD